MNNTDSFNHVCNNAVKDSLVFKCLDIWALEDIVYILPNHRRIAPMRPLVEKVGNALDLYLGRCPKCVRTAFVFMIIAICMASAAALMTHSPFFLVTSRLLALGSAGLWFSHLVAFALRSVRNASISCKTASSGNSNADHSLRTRRQFISTFAKSFMFAMVATALPVRSLFAADCPCAAPLKCCWDYTGQIYVCAASDAVCCTGKSPWSCPSKHNCLGDSGDCN